MRHTEVPMPSRIAKLPRAKGGHVDGMPVPFFVDAGNDPIDFRVADARKVVRCIKEGLCWICGAKLCTSANSRATFVLGPICVINRISSEPPSHLSCAEYAVRVCPFLAQPNMRRREAGKPEDLCSPGKLVKANPGVTALYSTYTCIPRQVSKGILIEVGHPCSVKWMTRGREATREEALVGLVEGGEQLQEQIEDELRGIKSESLRDVTQAFWAARYAAALATVPAEVRA